MRISDWSSDVCSSDLRLLADKLKKDDIRNFEKAAVELAEKLASDKALAQLRDQVRLSITDEGLRIDILDEADFAMFDLGTNQIALDAAQARGIPVFNAPYSNTRSVEIGRASCRERVCQYV